MKKSLKISALILGAAVAAAALAFALLGGRKEGERPRNAPLELFKSVPSDAVYAACFGNAAKGLDILLDPSSPLKHLDLCGLRDARMSFSYNYAAQLVPLLALEAGETPVDGICENASTLGLKTLEVSIDGKRVLLVSPSSSLLAQSRSHIEAASSILEAPLFRKALPFVSENAVIVRNSAVSRLLPKSFPMMEYISRKDICSFLKQFSEWMVFNLTRDGGFEMTPISDDSPIYYHKALAEGGESRIADILPYGVEFVVDFTFDDWKTRKALIDSYLDAHNKLGRHKGALKTAGSLDVKEIARIVFEGRELLLVRPDKVPSKIPSWNPDVIFGGIFDLSDKGCSVSYRDWIVYGRQQAVDSFIMSLKQAPAGWPEGKLDAILYSRNTGLITSRGEKIECEWNHSR